VATLLAVVLINYPGYAQTTTLIDALTETENQPGMALETYQAAIDYDAMGTQEARERLINTTQNIVSDNGVDSEIAQQYFTVAQDEIRVQIAEESEDLRHQVFLGQLMMVYGQYDEAVEAFATADEMGNGRKQANILRLAQAQFAAGNPEAAAESYARAYELDTSFDEPAIRYATGLIQIDEQEQADAVLENHFGTTTVNSEYLIKVYLDEEKYEKLIPILELRLQNNQTDIQPYINLASALVRTGRQADAQEVIDRAGQIFPQIEGQEDEVLQQLEDTNPLGS
jgi:cytochrome c-type biogenesis protein CcmH/NrfG